MRKSILCLALIAMSGPALAMATRPVIPSTMPVPPAERDALYAENNAFAACLGTRISAVRGSGDMAQMEIALNTAGGAANPNVNNYALFSAERTKFHAELARLKAKYGC